MIEELFVYTVLLSVELVSKSEYSKHLDALFMEAPDNDLLLELQWSLSDTQKTISTIRHYCDYHHIVDNDVFGKFLCQKLSEIYFRAEISIEEFGSKARRIWRQLPSTMYNIEPFWVLSYADDPLSWGDEKQAREIYEKMFRFYDENT